MPTKYLSILICGECPFYDVVGKCGKSDIPISGCMSPPPTCPIDSLNLIREPIQARTINHHSSVDIRDIVALRREIMELKFNLRTHTHREFFDGM